MQNYLKITSLLLSLLIVVSCRDEKPPGNLIEKRNDLIYRQKSDTPYTGIVKDTVNQKIMEYHVKGGLKDGQFKISRLNGQVEMVGNMVKDKNEGEWNYYYPNGQLESKGNFVNDTPSGMWTFYYETGIKKEEGEYKKGEREGKWIEYDSTGHVVKYKKFIKGVEAK